VNDEERIIYILRSSLRDLPNQAALRRIAQMIIETLDEDKPVAPEPEEPLLDALHIPHEAWERWRESLEWHYPNVTIVRLPDSEPGIRSWGITPRELHP
jgi:hypothetical protein